MRLALASLIAATSFSVAVAQDAAAPAAQPTSTTPEAPAPSETAAPQAAAPAEAAPAAPAEPPAPTYAAPTDATSISIINVLNTVCVPAVVGGDFEALAKTAGFKLKRDRWVLAQAKPYQIVLDRPGSNKNVCTVTIDHPTGLAQTLVTDLHGWASTREPILQLYRNDTMDGADFKRNTVSWENVTDGVTTGMVFVQLKKPDGSPVLKNADQSTLLYSVRK